MKVNYLTVIVINFVNNVSCSVVTEYLRSALWHVMVYRPPAVKVLPLKKKSVNLPPSPKIFFPAPPPPPPSFLTFYYPPPTGNGCFCIFHTWLLPTTTSSYF